jgi:large subunit ribosomal protein L24
MFFEDLDCRLGWTGFKVEGRTGYNKNMLNIKKKDKVLVLSGKDKGKRGEVLEVLPGEGKVIVAKINSVKRHTKPTQKSVGGILEKEAPIAMSKVMLVCPKCDQACRPKFDRLSDGEKVRVCRKCGEMIIV